MILNYDGTTSTTVLFRMGKSFLASLDSCEKYTPNSLLVLSLGHR